MNKTVCRPSFVSFPPAMSRACRIEFTGERPSYMIHIFFPSWWDRNMIQQVRIQSNLLSDLGRHEHTRDGCSSLRNTEIWVCCFLCECNPASENLRKFEYLRSKSRRSFGNKELQLNCSVNFSIKFSMSYEYGQSFRDLSQAGMSFHFLLSMRMNSFDG